MTRPEPDTHTLVQALLRLPPDEIDTSVRPISPEIADLLLEQQQAHAREMAQRMAAELLTWEPAGNPTLLEPAPYPIATATKPVDNTPTLFSNRAFALWAHMDDGSSFLAVIDPEPVDEPDA